MRKDILLLWMADSAVATLTWNRKKYTVLLAGQIVSGLSKIKYRQGDESELYHGFYRENSLLVQERFKWDDIIAIRDLLDITTAEKSLRVRKLFVLLTINGVINI